LLDYFTSEAARRIADAAYRVILPVSRPSIKHHAFRCDESLARVAQGGNSAAR
jgi:hypothetical protein